MIGSTLGHNGGCSLPYSSTNGKRFVQGCVDLLRHKREYTVLDLGAGSGTYSDLFRSQLKGKWTAVEVWEPYLTQFNLSSKYDCVFISDALSYLQSSQDSKYDVVFVGDMLEHMTKDEAAKVIEQVKRVAAIAFLSIPVGEYPQEAYLGNPYEEHKATWLQADVEALGASVTHYEGEIGVAVLGSLPVKIQGYCIAKNEEKFFSRMQRSVGVYTGLHMVVCDTGSKDSTLALAREHHLVQASFFPFRFDDARNVALGAVSLDVDYVISIDCDEIIPTGKVETLRKAIIAEFGKTGNLPDLIHHSFRTIWDWEGEGKNITAHFHSRVHRRAGCRWIHPVHEKLTWFSNNPHEMWYTDFLMEQLPDTSKDRSSYLPALRIAVKEDPDDWKLLSFLAAETSSLSYEEPQAALKKSLLNRSSDKAFISLKLGFLAEQWGLLDEAELWFEEATKLNRIREYYVYLAEFLQRHKRATPKIVAAWESAKAATVETHGYIRREDCWDKSIFKG